MPRLLRVHRALLKAEWATTLEYRAQAALWVLTAIFPLVMMAVWLVIVEEAGPAAGWDRADFVSYYVAAALVNQLTFAWVLWQWDEDIRTGALSAKLLRPLDPFHYLLSSQLGRKLFIVLLFVPIFALVTWVVPEVRYDLNLFNIGLFALSASAGFGLSMMIGCTFGVLAFWSTQARNLYGLWYGVGQFLSGWIAPLALFPATLRQVAYLLPFHSMMGLPIEILMGRLSASEIGVGFAVTGSYLLLFLFLYRVLWHAGLRRYEAVGA